MMQSHIFEAFFISSLIMGAVLCALILYLMWDEYMHPINIDYNSLASKALRRRSKNRIHLKASEVLRKSTRSKANMTAAGCALSQRRKS